MRHLKLFLALSTVLIYAVTVLAISDGGWFWPAVFFGDLVAGNWRSQFNADFLIHLILLASWVSWREGFGTRGYLFGFLSIFMGGMFGFPYILVALIRCNGNPKDFFMGVQSAKY